MRRILFVSMLLVLPFITQGCTNRPYGNQGGASGYTEHGGSNTIIPKVEIILQDDFSTENWPTDKEADGGFYKDGEYHMKGERKRYVYAFPHDSANYAAKDETIVKVTARSVDNESPEACYGLIIHGKENMGGQLDGYGFLIYTGAEPAYKIVRFASGMPRNIVRRTPSLAIRGGTNPNRMEVHIGGGRLTMYINNRGIERIWDDAKYAEGYVGLYTSEANEVAFDDLEISKVRIRD